MSLSLPTTRRRGDYAERVITGQYRVESNSDLLVEGAVPVGGGPLAGWLAGAVDPALCGARHVRRAAAPGGGTSDRTRYDADAAS